MEQEFREFLTCGVLAHGFARLRCTNCALERLVPFSCVLSLPYRLRHLLAWDHGLALAVLGVFVRVLLGFRRHRARRCGSATADRVR